jgi:hypothetical protein
MVNVEINHAPGVQIRRFREERGLRPADIQRISEAIKRRKNCPGFGISHASLNDIENHHSVPSVRKMFSLAVCLKVPFEQILALYGASLEDARMFSANPVRSELTVEPADMPFLMRFDAGFDSRLTAPLAIESVDLAKWLEQLRSQPAPGTYSYAWIGTHDDTMCDLIPGGSLVEVDRSQSKIEVLQWSKMRERPIYFCWTKDGYRCCWWEQDGNEVVMVPHPASRMQAKRYRQRREATVVGRVTHAWVPFGRVEAVATAGRALAAH